MNYSLAYIKSIWLWLVTLVSGWFGKAAPAQADTALWYSAPEWLSPSDKLKWVWASEPTAYWKARDIHSPSDLEGLVR